MYGVCFNGKKSLLLAKYMIIYVILFSQSIHVLLLNNINKMPLQRMLFIVYELGTEFINVA
jgi:hypothetical protein